MRKRNPDKHKGISRHSLLFLHVVCIHAVVMYLCSWYVEHARASTEMRLLRSNVTSIQHFIDSAKVSAQIM